MMNETIIAMFLVLNTALGKGGLGLFFERGSWVLGPCRYVSIARRVARAGIRRNIGSETQKAATWAAFR
jgi:hypothetical protein